MAAPSVGDIISALQIAYTIIHGCSQAGSDFEQAGIEAESVAINLEEVKRLYTDKKSFMNHPNNRKPRDKLMFYISKCKRALEIVQDKLDKYFNMHILKMMQFVLMGKADVADALSHLQFISTQMSNYIGFFDKTAVTSDRLERNYDRTKDAKKAVQKTCQSRVVSAEARASMERYATHLAKRETKRVSGKKRPTILPGTFLECWIVKSCYVQGVDKVVGKPVPQKRGQTQLWEMAKQFETHPGIKKIEAEADDSRVKWFLNEKRAAEKSKDYFWKFIAARIEGQSAGANGLMEEKLMVIVKRAMKKLAKEAHLKKVQAKQQKGTGNKDGETVQTSGQKKPNGTAKKDGQPGNKQQNPVTKPAGQSGNKQQNGTAKKDEQPGNKQKNPVAKPAGQSGNKQLNPVAKPAGQSGTKTQNPGAKKPGQTGNKQLNGAPKKDEPSSKKQLNTAAKKDGQPGLKQQMGVPKTGQARPKSDHKQHGQ